MFANFCSLRLFFLENVLLKLPSFQANKCKTFTQIYLCDAVSYVYICCYSAFLKAFVFNNFLLNGLVENWNNTALTWGLTCRDTTAWLGRSKRVMEPPWQYWVWPVLFVLEVATKNWNPSAHGCDVSVSPFPSMSRPTVVFSGAFSSQVKVLGSSARREGWVCTVDGLQASLVHSGSGYDLRISALVQ